MILYRVISMQLTNKKIELRILFCGVEISLNSYFFKSSSTIQGQSLAKFISKIFFLSMQSFYMYSFGLLYIFSLSFYKKLSMYRTTP